MSQSRRDVKKRYILFTNLHFAFGLDNLLKSKNHPAALYETSKQFGKTIRCSKKLKIEDRMKMLLFSSLLSDNIKQKIKKGS